MHKRQSTGMQQQHHRKNEWINHTSYKKILVSLQALIIRHQYCNAFNMFYSSPNTLLSLFQLSSATLGGMHYLKNWDPSILIDLFKHTANKFIKPRLEFIFWIQVWNLPKQCIISPIKISIYSKINKWPDFPNF